MNHKIILKCRVCLDEFDEEKMFDLFTTDKPENAPNADDSNDGNKSSIVASKRLKLSEKLEFCCGVRIRESSEMPTKICIKCFDITRIWFNFRQMCVNSQVYLESMCKDRCSIQQQDFDEDNYLEYLLEDLQTFRCDARHTNICLSVNAEADDDDHNDSDSANADMEPNQTDSDNDYFEGLPLEAADSDPEFDYIIENIKKEQHYAEQLDVREKKKTREKRVSGMERQQRRNVEENYIDKKRLRPVSPTSYMCSICGNVYTKKASFTYHMSLHSNVKPHDCELCGKSFRQVCELKNHMRRHTGEKPYKCSYCDRHFIDRSERHRHERVHTNTRPYVCSVCGKSFMYSAILKNHLKLHSGEKEYNCLVCQKAFTLQHQLKAHLQTITHKQKESQFVNAGYEVVYE